MVAELKRLEKLVFDDKERLDDAWLFKPGPDVHYQMTLEYLAELCLFIEEKYNKEIVHGIDRLIGRLSAENKEKLLEYAKLLLLKQKHDAENE